MAEGLLQTARAVSQAALTVDGVHSLGTGTFAEAATYEGGDKVSGVVVGDEEVAVHVVLDYPLTQPIPKLAAGIEEKVSPVADGRRVHIVFQDFAEDSELAGDE